MILIYNYSSTCAIRHLSFPTSYDIQHKIMAPKIFSNTLCWQTLFTKGSRRRDRMVIGFTTNSAISTYHHESCEFESRLWRGELDTTLCDKVCRRLATGQWFSPGTPVSPTNKSDRHNITEILVKVTLNTIHQTNPCILWNLSLLISETIFDPSVINETFLTLRYCWITILPYVHLSYLIETINKLTCLCTQRNYHWNLMLVCCCGYLHRLHRYG